MPPRDQELPEGTDHIINGAMETGAGTGASTGSTGSGFGGTGSGGTMPGGSADFAGTSGTGAAGGASGGFIGAGAGGTSDDTAGLTGGTGAGLAGGSDYASGSTGSGGSGGFGGGPNLGGGGSGGGFGGSGGGSGDFGGGSSGSGGGNGLSDQARGGVQTLKQQATDKVRTYAEDGKSRATSALDDFAQLVNETAQTIDERLGAQYGDYARRAAGTVTDLSENLRNKQVDELFDDARSLVRKSPAVAIGAAAAVGFALVRLIKSGIPDDGTSGGGSDVNFQPDPQLGSTAGSSGTTTGGSSYAGASSVDSQAPYVAPTTGV